MQLSFVQNLKLKTKIFVICMTNGWSWDHIRRVTHSVWLDSDTTTIRIILANASFLWAFFVMLDPIVFERPAYEIMRAVAPGHVWAAMFLLHFVGVYWRTYDPVARVLPGLIVNGYGFLIWFFSTVSLNFYVGALSPGTACELCMCAASAWALYKVGFQRELISP